MQIRVLGCYGSELPNFWTSGFLINGSVLLDAGTICSSLTLAEQGKIQYVLVSHIHVDHIKGLAALSENLFAERGKEPVVIISLPQVLEGLQENFFNNRIWPDFTKLPNSQNPIFRLKAVPEGEWIKIGGLEVKALEVNHVIPCAGFLIRDGNAALVYSGDTYQTDKIWQAAAAEPSLRAAFIETTFPNDLEDMAVRSKHLTPRLLLEEFSKIGKPDLPLYAYHIKPRYLEEIRAELRQPGIKNLNILKDEVVLDL